MTRAAEIRASVLAYAEEGKLEDEIASAVGIPVQRVVRLLDAVEAEPVRMQEEYIPRAAPRRDRKPRTASSTSPSVQPAVRKRKYVPTGRPTGQRKDYGPAQHGTASGYNSLHTRLGLPPCAECREAARLESIAKRLRAGKKTQAQLDAERTAYRYHRWAVGFTATSTKSKRDPIIKATKMD